MTNEFELRDTARELKAHYLELQQLKHTTPNPPEVKTRNSVKGLGPKSPGNWLWIERYVTLEQRLREVTLNALGKDGINTHITGQDLSAPRLCRLIAWNAHQLTQLAWVEDLTQELQDQARQINRWVNPPQTPSALIRQAQSSTQLLTAAHAAAAATAATGHRIDRKQITYWGKAGYITAHRDTEGNTCYQLNDIIKHINSK
ncbi:hypothetical protein QPX34_07060 [Corynebacterium accolens]|uniref:Uncharacterized protein n=1 Tax=Corynebacterium accolens TaxID=38284 RepID=A0ABT7FQA4_9CORY|nr:hypothetical protein [Corynebacterium accolens]MDK4247784.1 hypothetical protein [Corynebacterium accolens]MDK4338311.1 hypothetical protein [Corynebacterium accolens]